jgi:hypothetical protein
MTIEALSINVDGTPAFTGGTATSVLEMSNSNLSKRIALDDSTEFLAQTNLTFSKQDPKVVASAPNGYSQGRSKVTMIVPLLLDNGKLTESGWVLEHRSDVELTDAERLTQRINFAQLIVNSALDDFYNKRALS